MRIPPVADDQHGLFGRHQALSAAASEGAFNRRRTASTSTPARGVYLTLSAEATNPRDRHLLAARATIMSLGDSWCVARRTAAVLHGLPLLGYTSTEVQLTRDRARRSVRSSSRHRHINALLDAERTVLDGIPTTTLARTVFDLARRESIRSAIVVCDAALRSGLTPGEVVAVLEAHRGWPGARRARAVLAFADGRAESPLESLGRLTCLEEDLPVFEPQVEVRLYGDLIARVDGLWREQLVVFEGDGAMKFDGEGVLPELLVRQERLREAGLTVVRAGWGDVTRRRQQWAAGVRRELAENPGRLRGGVELASTRPDGRPLDRNDHYLWTPPIRLSTQHAALATSGPPSGRRVA